MTDFVALKRKAHGLLHALARSGDAGAVYAADAMWNGSHPFNERTGPDGIGAVWAELRAAIPDLERRDEIFVAGASRPDPRTDGALTGRPLVAALGTYQGTMRGDFCGIPATGGVVALRFCEVHHLDGDRIAASYVLWDLLDLMRQAGCWPLPPSLGAEGMWRGPASADGLRLDTHDDARGAAGFEVVMDMHSALATFDGRDIESMDIARYWTQDFMWYGPAGIGSTRGLDGFRAHHQIPFLVGFRDRAGSGHYVRIADGDYVVTGGWPSVVATHTGEWLGTAPTGRRIEMRVMDFYRLEHGRIAENWVPIDVIDMLLQMGVDVLGRVRHRAGRPPARLPQS